MPTTNPVPSTDPSDLLFNAGKLDEVVNGTANSFTDRLGSTRRTVAGMNADFDAQLADAESDLNVYRADAAASAAEALGYLQTIRATSYGAYASDPATDPLGNPPTVGDEYFNTTANLLKRWNGTTWQASDINTANLAAPSGSSFVGYMPAGTGAVATTVQEKLRQSKSFKDNSSPVAAIANLKTNGGGVLRSDGSNVDPGTGGLTVSGEMAKGATLDFGHSIINYASGTGFTAGGYADPGDQRRMKVWLKDLNVKGPGKSVTGSVALKVDETADIFTFGGWLRDSETGLLLNGALLCDFHSLMIRANKTGISANPTVHFSTNHNNFYSAKLFDNDVAINYDGPGLASVNWFGCEIEGNNLSGTPTDGVSVIKLTNAGRHNLIGCHLEQNLGQFGLDYSGIFDDKNLLILGSQLVSQSDTELQMRKGKLTAIASYIASGASSKDINIETGATATLIDTEGTVTGDVSRVVSLNYGRLRFGGNAYKADAPIVIQGSSYYSGIAQRFISDSTTLQFDNAANARIGYVFCTSAGIGMFGDGIPTSIGQNTGARFVVGRASLMTVEPGADNNTSCGSAAVRFSTVYAATGTINTSDRNAKQQIRELSEAERAVAVRCKSLIRAFKLNDAVEQKGDNARIHFGVIAQDVQAAFEAEGLDSSKYALFCRDEWAGSPEVRDEHGNVISPAIAEGTRLGIRYEQLLAFIISAL